MWVALGGFRLTTALVVVILSSAGVQAAVDYRQCCMKVPVSEELRPLQWSACHSQYNASGSPAPDIATTYEWCRKNCETGGKFKVSGISDWLTPVAAWIIPTAALLLLLPVSEHLMNDRQISEMEWYERTYSRVIGGLFHIVMEYIQILGDPASAFNGALAQIFTDWMLCLSMGKEGNGERERDLILTVMLVDQGDHERRQPMGAALELMAGSREVREYSRPAGRVIWSARKKFNTSVLLPVALYIAVAASVFYDAYQKLGDTSTAYSLAYGVWYNWILLLAVFANCFASHSNLDAVRSGLEVILRGATNHTEEALGVNWHTQGPPLSELYALATRSLEPIAEPSSQSSTLQTNRVSGNLEPITEPPAQSSTLQTNRFSGNLECKGAPLNGRYLSTRNWVQWLDDNGVDVDRPTKGIRSCWLFCPNWYSRSYPNTMYLVTQILAWSLVLFCCACSGILSYTTPKVGLGCRSFNQVIYTSAALLLAILRVVKDCLRGPEWPITYKTVTFIYYFLVTLNAIVILIGGSLMQMTGVFDNCWCLAGIPGQNENSTMVLSTNTEAHQYWARNVWLRVAFAAYGGVAAMSFAALAIRQYITNTIRTQLTK